MRKKRILGIFGNVANAGQERANSDVYKLLAQDDKYDLRVLVNDRGFHWCLQPFFEQNSIPFKKIRFPWGIYKNSSLRHIAQWIIDIFINNFQFIYNYLKFKPDYIHIGNEYMFKTLAIPLCLCRSKIIFRLGDRPYTNNSCNKFLWKLIAANVNTFVCDTHFIKNLLIQTGRNNPNDVVLYHPAPNRVKTSANETDKSNQRSSQRSIVFGYVGQINESKGVKLIVQCAEKICAERDDVEFWFAGTIYNNRFYTESIEPIMQAMPNDIRARIRFLGHVENIDLYYSMIDVHIAPSISEEAYGLVLVEAKKNHKPSIIFQSVGMPELICHTKNGFISNSKDIEGLIEGIRYYLERPEAIRLHGKNAFNSLSELGINFDNFRKQWLSIYH